MQGREGKTQRRIERVDDTSMGCCLEFTSGTHHFNCTHSSTTCPRKTYTEKEVLKIDPLQEAVKPGGKFKNQAHYREVLNLIF